MIPRRIWSDRSETTAVRADRDHRSRLGYTDRMSVNPLAYHITFGTYGTRLHGDPRGTVDRKANKPGDPIIGAEPDWERMERSSLRFPAMLLTTENRSFIEFVVPSLCDRGGWELHVCAAKPDHVHVLLATSREAKPVRRWLKTWLSQALNECLGSEPPAVPTSAWDQSRPLCGRTATTGRGSVTRGSVTRVVRIEIALGGPRAAASNGCGTRSTLTTYTTTLCASGSPFIRSASAQLRPSESAAVSAVGGYPGGAAIVGQSDVRRSFY